MEALTHTQTLDKQKCIIVQQFNAHNNVTQTDSGLDMITAVDAPTLRLMIKKDVKNSFPECQLKFS